MQRGFAPVIVLIGILVIAVVAGGAYYLQSKEALPYFFRVKTPEQKACTQEAKLCPDGSSVGRVGPNCEFTPCPSPSSSQTDKTATPKTLQEVRVIKEKYQEQLLNIENVSGLGVSTCDGKYCIEVYLKKDDIKTRSQISDNFDGVQVRIIVTGEVKPL